MNDLVRVQREELDGRRRRRRRRLRLFFCLVATLGIVVVAGLAAFGVAAAPDGDAPDGDAPAGAPDDGEPLGGGGGGRTTDCARATPPTKTSVRQAVAQRIRLSVFATGLTVKL